MAEAGRQQLSTLIIPPPPPLSPCPPIRCASQAADLALHQLMASTTLLLAKEAAVAKHGNTGSSLTAAGGAGGGRRRAPPTRVWECLTAVASGDLNGLLESETAGGGAAGLLDSMAASGAGAVGRPAVEVRGGTGGEVAAGLSCQRLLVEAGAFERFGYSDMAAACARAVLQVGTWVGFGRPVVLRSVGRIFPKASLQKLRP